MKLRTRHALGEAALAAALANRSRLLAALSAVTLALSGQMAAEATAGPVGHRVETITVPGAEFKDNPRNVKVHLWYPADQQGFAGADETVYTSALHGQKPNGFPATWNPLSWKVDAEVAREAKIDPNGEGFPVIVFSHGNVNDPIDYAHTLELIADAGFVVAAPYHVNNTQDDVRRDFANSQAGQRLFDCDDGRTSGTCSRPNVPFSMADRVSDIAKILDELPKWFGDRVDVDRAGLLGHSRGTATVLAAAGGTAPRSTDANCQSSGDLCWPLASGQEHGLKQVKAVMGMAIAAPPIVRGVDLKNVKVPALLVAGGRDQTSPADTSKFAYEQISSEDKKLVLIDDAVHRTFDSTYCDQAQASGAFAQKDPDRAILDRHTARLILAGGTSGRAMDYCTYPTFTKPTDIRPLVKSLTGFEVTEENVPSTDLTSDAVKARVKALAVPFFRKVLGAQGKDVTDTTEDQVTDQAPSG